MTARFFWCLAIWLAACSSPLSRAPDVTQDNVCSAPESERAVACMIACAAAANPKSDEEGEDLVKQCDQSCTRLLCRTPAWRYWSGSGWEPCESGDAVAQRACRASGWKSSP